MSNIATRHIGLLRELMNTRVVMMEASALNNYRQQLLHNFNTHVSASSVLDDIIPTERHYMLVCDKATNQIHSVQFFNENNVLVEENEEGDEIVAREPEQDEQRILMLEMCGPVTRCGGMCSYGSIDFRDLMLQYADDESVIGLVLITDTPGGTAFALHDFAQGMEAWNAAGKRSIQWIDGMSCSAGVALGSQCQRVIAMNGHDIVGCIGAMMAGWTTADGTVDSDGNRFMDITATQTPDKNGTYHDAANGDYKGLQAEVDECAADFLSMLDTCRPQIPADQRTGKTYNAMDVVGTLVDGIGTLEDAIHYIQTGEETWSSASSVAPSDGQDPVVPTHPEPDPEDPAPHDPHDPEETPDEQTIDDMTQQDINRIAAAFNLDAAAIQDVLEHPTNNEEAVATDVQPNEEVEQPTQTEEAESAVEEATSSDDATLSEGAEAQTEDHPTQDEEATASDVSESEGDPSQSEAPQVEEAEASNDATAVVSDDAQASTEEHSAEDPALAAINALQAQINAQMAAHEAELQQLRDQLAERQQELENAQQEAAQLRSAAPAPAMPAAAPHAQQTTAPSRIDDTMTPAEKLKAWKQRGAQLVKARLH